MLFNSWSFLILLLITLPLYYIPIHGAKRRVWQIGLLLTTSAVFYAWNEPRLLFLLFGSCLRNAVAVERILFHKSRNVEKSESRKPGERGTTDPIQNPKSKIQNPKFRIQSAPLALDHGGTEPWVPRIFQICGVPLGAVA